MTPWKIAELKWADRLYHPPVTGLHVCGSNEDDAAMTLASWPLSEELAREILADLEPEYRVSRDDGDSVLDLYLNSDLEDGWFINRQMIPRIEGAIQQAYEASGRIKS